MHAHTHTHMHAHTHTCMRAHTHTTTVLAIVKLYVGLFSLMKTPFKKPSLSCRLSLPWCSSPSMTEPCVCGFHRVAHYGGQCSLQHARTHSIHRPSCAHSCWQMCCCCWCISCKICIPKAFTAYVCVHASSHVESLPSWTNRFVISWRQTLEVSICTLSLTCYCLCIHTSAAKCVQFQALSLVLNEVKMRHILHPLSKFDSILYMVSKPFCVHLHG